LLGKQKSKGFFSNVPQILAERKDIRNFLLHWPEKVGLSFESR